MKTCSQCKVEKPKTEYHKMQAQKSGLRPECKACTKKKKDEWRAANPDKHKAGYDRYNKYYREGPLRQKLFGITKEEYDKLLADQDGVCVICRDRNNDSTRSLAVDHDHETGIVRGILCDRCNRGIGYFRESLELIERTVQYLTGV